MKTSILMITLIVISLTCTFAYGLVMPMTTQEVLNEFDLIVLGTITDKNQSEGNAPTYTIEIEETVKMPDSIEMPKSVLAIGCNQNTLHLGTPCPSYDVGDRGLFLLAGSENNYEVSYRSQISEHQCTSDQFLANYKGLESPLEFSQNGNSKRFFTDEPIDIHFIVSNREMKEKDYSVKFDAYSGNFTFFDVVNGTINECLGSVTVSTSFIPTEMGTYGIGADGNSMFGLAVIDKNSPPLKQHKAGVHSQDTWCKDGLLLVLKHDDTPNLIFDNKPACVKPNTVSKLSERDTIKMASFYNNRPLIERLYVGMEILRLSDIPIKVMGLYEQDQVLEVMIDEDELNKIPNAEDYFNRIIREEIPFNVPLKITFGKYWGG